jgi:hypothetical protein
MLNIFDVANVSVFIEKSGDNSIIGSWNRIKTELEELGTSPNKPSVPLGCPECGVVNGHWYTCSKNSVVPHETAHVG